MQGKLKSFVALKDANGTHVTYTSDKGTYYKFTNTFDCNGEIVTGTAMSKNQQPTWKINDEYSFEKKVSGEQGQYVNISGMKSLTSTFGGGAKQSNPSFHIQKAIEAAYECACAYFELNPEHSSIENINKLYASLYTFIITPKDEPTRWLNISGLRAAIQTLRAYPSPILKEGQTLSAWMLETARLFSETSANTVKQQLENDKPKNGTTNN